MKETKDKLEETNSQKTHLETVLAAHTGSWLKEIQIGTKLDAKDKFGRWYEGTIIAMHGNDQVRVHFDGWNSNFDELMVKSPERLAPLHLHSIKRKNKRKAQRKFRDFEDGDIIDCKDTMGDWYESVVLDVKDDQVLISSSTNMACPFSVDYCGAIPIPVDIEKETWQMGILFYFGLVGLGLGAAFAINKILKTIKLI